MKVIVVGKDEKLSNERNVNDVNNMIYKDVDNHFASIAPCTRHTTVTILTKLL